MRDTTRVHERALFVGRDSIRVGTASALVRRRFRKRICQHEWRSDRIVQFGVWNREAGPDFRDAAIRINGGEPIHGCIEIDLLDRSWESHGHATNPAFEATALHVFVEE
jgi:Protein of unknown function (DUF2851).